MLSICIPTLSKRHRLFARLVSVLSPQVSQHYGKVKVTCYFNSGEEPIGTIRQRLLDSVDTKYVCYIDDDDMIAPYFVTKIMTELYKNVDIVGIRQLFWIDNERQLDAIIDYNRFDNWFKTEEYYARDLAHELPMRTWIARLGRWDDHQHQSGEDRNWVRQIREELQGRKIKSSYIDDPMYYYWFNWDHSIQGSAELHDGIERKRPELPQYFSWHEDSPAMSPNHIIRSTQ